MNVGNSLQFVNNVKNFLLCEEMAIYFGKEEAPISKDSHHCQALL